MEIEGVKYLLEEVIGNPIVIADWNAIINLDSASDRIQVDGHLLRSRKECQRHTLPIDESKSQSLSYGSELKVSTS